MIGTALALIAGTFVSEDATSVLTGALIHRGEISWPAGVAACAAGIFLGDLGLWLIGRLGGARVLHWKTVRERFGDAQQLRAGAWFADNAATLIVSSRLVPGTRLPLYLAAGAIGGSFGRFAVWSLVAVSLWTPLVVLAAAGGLTVLSPALDGLTEGQWWITVAVALLLLAMGGLAAALKTRRSRQQFAAALSRVWRWEFWPMWIFYAPVAMWLAWLVVRHRGIGAIAAANPGMQDGGIVGESKHEILTRLPSDWTLPSFLVDRIDADGRAWQFASGVASRGWRFPLVLKPDIGQRGGGVRLITSLNEARDYLSAQLGPVVVQQYHPGPFEAGVFYYRMPDEPKGRVLSVTDKHFPFLVGDGVSTLEDLIWAESRLRMQAATFLARHGALRTWVLAAGERLRLAFAGNHAQGTLFRDGHHLITPALEDRIDQIARSYPGFFIGRFDVRYADVERFKAGDDLAIVELNGATAESTNIYDPHSTLASAYRQLFRQWSLVFAIGDANLRRGAGRLTVARLVALLRAHRTTRVAFDVSD
jgi:membrane protein DedA with SNARE-associated domain